MPASTMTYVLSHIRQNIPSELLQLAFKPRKYNTTIEQRIISEVIEGPILLDTNLIGGKRREIYLNDNWIMDMPRSDPSTMMGHGVEGSFYMVPPEAREGRNISSVIGITPFLGGAAPGVSGNYNGTGSFGNTASSMLSEMLNSRTFAQYPVTPQLTLEGTNIIRMFPDIIANGVAVSVLLENDSEFLNANPSTIMSLRKLCLCAVQRYIATNLRVSIDETEVVAGMEIGVIKTMVEDYGEKAKEYDELLTKVKGSMTFDQRSLSRIIYHAL